MKTPNGMAVRCSSDQIARSKAKPTIPRPRPRDGCGAELREAERYLRSLIGKAAQD